MRELRGERIGSRARPAVVPLEAELSRAAHSLFWCAAAPCGEKAMPAEETRANFAGKVFGVEAQVVC